MTVLQAALEILRDTNERLNAKQIYEKICEKNLYVFGAKDPVAVVSAALRKATKDVAHEKGVQRNTDGTYKSSWTSKN